MFYCKLLSNIYNVKHCFFSKNGGTSTGNFASLNTGYVTGDNLENVANNRNIVAKYFNIKSNYLLTPRQTHNNNVIIVNNQNLSYNIKNIQADALVTNSSNVALGVNTADCLPILLVDANNNIIGAAHAGWKGLVGNVIYNTVKAMQNLGANTNNIIASIGPSIAYNNYQVDDKFYNQLIKINSMYKQFFTSINNKLHFNLQQLAEYLLNNCGVNTVNNLQLDTYSLDKDFFSHRRSTHLKHSSRGVQISTIMLTK